MVKFVIIGTGQSSITKQILEAIEKYNREEEERNGQNIFCIKKMCEPFSKFMIHETVVHYKTIHTRKETKRLNRLYSQKAKVRCR